MTAEAMASEANLVAVEAMVELTADEVVAMGGTAAAVAVVAAVAAAATMSAWFASACGTLRLANGWDV